MNFVQGMRPATLAAWKPKMNAEAEKRLLVSLEIALTDEVLAQCPKNIRSISKYIAKVENAVPESPITTEYTGQELEIFLTPDSSRPALVLSNTTVQKILVFRTVAAEGPTPETFLRFEVHTGPYNDEMLCLVDRLWKKTCFVSFHTMQGTIPGTEHEPDAETDGKSAAAGE